MSTDNALSSRFLADAEFKTQYDDALANLRTELYDSGAAQNILDKWTTLLSTQAEDLVPAETVRSEAGGIAKFFTSEVPAGS